MSVNRSTRSCAVDSQRVLHWEADGKSDVGRQRERNEDAFAIIAEQGIYIVADGVGGAAGGDIASEAVVSVTPIKLEKRLATIRRNAAMASVERIVRDALQEINDALVAEAAEKLGDEATGTTVVLALAWKGRILICHLGDSRAYLLRDGTLTQLTEDHTLTAQLVRWGNLPKSRAEDHPGHSTLLRYVGVDEQLVPDFHWLIPIDGDQVLLCTDGLTNMVKDNEIARIMSASRSVEQCCKSLIKAANEAGGMDNITVLNLRIKDTESSPNCRTNVRER